MDVSKWTHGSKKLMLFTLTVWLNGYVKNFVKDNEDFSATLQAFFTDYEELPYDRQRHLKDRYSMEMFIAGKNSISDLLLPEMKKLSEPPKFIADVLNRMEALSNAKW